MNEKPKKRSWFQFHLSTAIVLMFVASGLLWMNIQPSKGHEVFSMFYSATVWGCPFPVYVEGDTGGSLFWLPGLILDAAISVGLLVVVAFVCEWRIHRKTGQLALWLGRDR